MNPSPAPSPVAPWRPEDDGWVATREQVPDPLDAVHHLDGGSLGWDAPGPADAELLESRGAVSEWDLPLLVSIDPESLHDAWSRLDYLRRAEAVEAMVAAVKARGVVALAGREPSASCSDGRHVAMEVAHARRVGEGAASSGIEVARTLHSTLPCASTRAPSPTTPPTAGSPRRRRTLRDPRSPTHRIHHPSDPRQGGRSRAWVRLRTSATGPRRGPAADMLVRRVTARTEVP